MHLFYTRRKEKNKLPQKAEYVNFIVNWIRSLSYSAVRYKLMLAFRRRLI